MSKIICQKDETCAGCGCELPRGSWAYENQKELKQQIGNLYELLEKMEMKFSDMISFYNNQQKMINKIHSRIDKQINRINELFKIHEENCDIQSKNCDLHNKRWEMLKEYFKIKEEDYAELEYLSSGSIFNDLLNESDQKAVKKTRLVKVKNKLKK